MTLRRRDNRAGRWGVARRPAHRLREVAVPEMWLKVEQGIMFWTWSLKCGERELGGLALSRAEAWDYAFRKRATILGSQRIATWLKSLADRGPLGA